MSTRADLLQKGETVLKAAGIETPRLDAWLLLEHTLDVSRAAFYADPKAPADPDKEKQYWNLVKARAAHEPLQYLTGEAFFMDCRFQVDSRVLIPRQDTETLVEEALGLLTEMPSPRLLDLCTGSGCILLSLLVELEKATGLGTDISPQALEVARKNASLLGVQDRASFLQADLFANVPHAPFHMILSNPPYIPTGDLEGLMPEVRDHEPKLALDGGRDGLAFYRRIAAQSPSWLGKGGWLLCEIGCSQAQEVKDLFLGAGFSKIRVVEDLAGKPRLVLGQIM